MHLRNRLLVPWAVRVGVVLSWRLVFDCLHNVDLLVLLHAGAFFSVPRSVSCNRTLLGEVVFFHEPSDAGG